MQILCLCLLWSLGLLWMMRLFLFWDFLWGSKAVVHWSMSMFNKTLFMPELGLHFLSYKKMALAVTCSMFSKYSTVTITQLGWIVRIGSELRMNPCWQSRDYCTRLKVLLPFLFIFKLTFGVRFVSRCFGNAFGANISLWDKQSASCVGHFFGS